MMREDEDAAPDNKRKRDGVAGDAVPRRRRHLESSSEEGGEHVGNSSIFVQCFLPVAFRESIIFCFVLFCMLKECSAVLYLDAVWVLYATLLCVLSCQADLLVVGSGEGEDDDEAESEKGVLPVAENGI